MINKILVATGNKGKMIEISKLLDQIGISAVPATDFALKEPEESGKTFEENSIIKAKYYGDATNLISLADDSGLCIEDLNNDPGVFSARWAKNNIFATAFDRIREDLIRKYINPEVDRPKAHFICNLSIYNPETKFIKSFEGRVDGTLKFPASGVGGFGYDPIFVPQGYEITFAEMKSAEKDKISHRAKAFSSLLEWLETPNKIFNPSF